MNVIGVIGGSGFYSFLDDPREQTATTYFGNATLYQGHINSHEIIFIPRHGKSHSVPPHKINYRANVLAAYHKGVDKLFATNAVGSSNPNAGAGSFVVLDQIIDMTHGRANTFFEGSDFAITTRTGKDLAGVVHTDVSKPFDDQVRGELISACSALGEDCLESGTIAVFNGPRFETPAEVNALTQLGAHYFGMTSAPEAFLAKEIDIPYATLAVVTNFAAGMQASLTHDEVSRIFEEKIDLIKKIISKAISNSNS